MLESHIITEAEKLVDERFKLLADNIGREVAEIIGKMFNG